LKKWCPLAKTANCKWVIAHSLCTIDRYWSFYWGIPTEERVE
jgi:hypothetical protein